MLDAVLRMIGPLGTMVNLFRQLVGLGGTTITVPGTRPQNHAPHPGVATTSTVTLNVQGGSPEVIEQSVRRALTTIQGRTQV